MSTIKNYLNTWYSVSPWSYRIAFFALGYSVVSLFIAQEDFIMLDNLFTSLDKFYQERPWYFRIMFFALGYMITDLVAKATRKQLQSVAREKSISHHIASSFFFFA